MFGKKVRVTAFELCYNATDADVTIVDFVLEGAHQTTWSKYGGNFIVLDSTDYDDATCRMFTPASTSAGDAPMLLGRNGFVAPKIELM